MGVGRYVVALIEGLAAHPDVELHVMAKHRDAGELRALGATVHGVALRTRPARLAFEQTLLPLRVRSVAPDVFHGPHYTAPPGLRCPVVVTFHDPTFFTDPQLHERTKVAWFTRMAKAGARRARRIVAVSEYAKRGAVRYVGADADRVDVVHEGVDLDTYSPGEPDGRMLERLGARRPFLFWVGAVEPRKDTPAIVRAFAKLVSRGMDLRLVLAGPRRWGATQLDEAVESSGVADRVLRPGYVSDDEKIALYRGAGALVYPSIAEGFGRQVLEAMACGCPVVTTTGSAPEEVGGDAVVLVPAQDDAALVAGVERALDAGAELRSRGLERARGFSLERTAVATLATYRRALEPRP